MSVRAFKRMASSEIKPAAFTLFRHEGTETLLYVVNESDSQVALLSD